ncbi:MAG: alpha/beta hydrolase [Betaproteobacteria bacterium]
MKNHMMSVGSLLAALWTPLAQAAPCTSEDFVTRVSGGGECLVIEAFGAPPTAPPAAMVVWLHGDQSDGAPVVSHVQPARQAATRFAAEHVVSIALWRPGYANAQGDTSGGDRLGSSDSYTKTNMQIVGDAIARLKAHYQPARTVLVGHSGGAATTANLLGMQPGLADAAVLVSCPCDLRAWRAGRRGWPNSEDPLKWADQVRPPVKVVALTGTADTNTSPKLAQTYLNVLVAHQVEARFTSIPDVPHNGALRAPEVMDALASVLK